ncbi:hypothetical protein G714_04290 [Escherichia coli HVH 39 (4-2679949)]|uniref:AHH domain-containing protein n=1 Tax=Escherichia coli TaxID=562 RepID=UPI0003903B08|nr:AHH domain-containing protein [Escherichia coli]EQO38510.1 hypothetical protein G714_04290 [Escherichia coli HVH 39 (4-2679949)]
MKKFIYILILIFSFTSLPKANANWSGTDKLIGASLLFAVGSTGLIVLNELRQKETNEFNKKFSPTELFKFIKRNQLARTFLEDELRYKMSSEKIERNYIFMQKIADLFNVSDVPPFMPENSSKYNPGGMEGHNGNIDNKLVNPINEVYFPYILENPETGEKIDTRLEFPMETPKDWDEYILLRDQHSKDLARSLINSGLPRPDYSVAHHIIPATMKDAIKAREILLSYGIHFNDAENGVWLPQAGKESGAVGLIHSGVHPRVYAKWVNQEILSVQVSEDNPELSKQKLTGKLNEIRQKLIDGQKNGKNWYDIMN